MKNGLAEWLSTPDGRDALSLCSNYVEREARRKGIDLPQLFKEEGCYAANDMKVIIINELVAFLLEHQEAVVLDVAEDEAVGDISAVSSKITTKFIMHLLDKRRTYPVSPFHAYLRQLRKVLSQAEEVRFDPGDGCGSFFAYTTEESIPFLPHSHWDLPFDEWPSPSVPHAVIHERVGILPLSRFYWDEATIRYAAEYLYPLKELCRFVFANYTVSAQPWQPKGLDSEGDTPFFEMEQARPARLPGDPLGTYSRQSERLDYDIIETQLTQLAGQCMAGLTDRQGEILVYAADGENLSEIARRIGESRYRIEQQLEMTRQHILRFWSLWGNAQLPGFTEEDEEEQLIFIEKIVELCKNRIGGREGL